MSTHRSRATGTVHPCTHLSTLGLEAQRVATQVQGLFLTTPQYRCRICTDYDMCMNCHMRGVVHRVDGKRHDLRLHDPSSEPNVFVERRKQQLQQQNRRRLNDILVHSTTCRNNGRFCRVYGYRCLKIGHLLRHWKSCPHTADRMKCEKCRAMVMTLKYHHSICKDPKCLVPGCAGAVAVGAPRIGNGPNQPNGLHHSATSTSTSTASKSTALVKPNGTTSAATTAIAPSDSPRAKKMKKTLPSPTSQSSTKENKNRGIGLLGGRSRAGTTTTITASPTEMVLNRAKKRKPSTTATPVAKSKLVRTGVAV